jgi:alternate signal-mediated exported protein
MKYFKNLSQKQKRIFAVSGLAVALLLVGGTIAYHQDSMFFKNLFQLAGGSVEFSEVFDSPTNWVPCQETEKTAVATNHDDTPRYVRMKLEKFWKRGNSTADPKTDRSTELPLTWNDNGVTKEYAVVNTQNDEHWELRDDGWYYYDTAIGKDQSTLSLLESVTLNCDANFVGGVTYSNDHLAGESNPSDYANARFHLYITFQMSDQF